MFWLAVISISLFLVCLPLLVAGAQRYVPSLPLQRSYPVLPVLAGLLFFSSFLLPDIGISSQTDTFQQHFVGGGIVSALLYVYARRMIRSQVPWPIELGLLFAWTSTLSVLSELGEFTLNATGLMAINTADTGWDLLANVMGAFAGYALIRIFHSLHNR